MKIVPSPPHCSSCWAQQTEKRHVDFESSYDGPVFTEGVATGDPDNPVVNKIPVAIDELIICEDCLATAAKLLGFVLPDEQTEKVAELEGQLDNLRDGLIDREEYVHKLEEALGQKPGVKLDRAVRDVEQAREVPA